MRTARRNGQQFLRAIRGRGGYRAKAGRKPGRTSPWVPHVRRPELRRHQAVHVTLHVVEGVPSLRRPSPTRLMQAVFRAECDRKGFRLVHYAIRSNHLHLVCEADQREALSRGIQRLGSRIARRLNELLGRAGRFFRDRFHARAIGKPRPMRAVLSYVLLNEQKDRAQQGQVLRGIDGYSSGRYFDGWADVSPSAPLEGERAPPVTQARSWLLRQGWRRRNPALLRTTERASPTHPLH
jgi:REP element-mobilizing transposase RayT